MEVANVYFLDHGVVPQPLLVGSYVKPTSLDRMCVASRKVSVRYIYLQQLMGLSADSGIEPVICCVPQVQFVREGRARYCREVLKQRLL